MNKTAYKIAEIIAGKNKEITDKEISNKISATVQSSIKEYKTQTEVFTEKLESIVNKYDQITKTQAEGFANRLELIAARSRSEQPQINVLSKAARYVIRWLTQIETAVYDSEVQIQGDDQNSYKDLIADRKKQTPTETCRCILREYKDLLENFDGLFHTEKIKAKTLDELQKYLDQVGQQIVSLKQMVAAKVKDSPDTEACIIPPQKSQVTQSKRS